MSVGILLEVPASIAPELIAVRDRQGDTSYSALRAAAFAVAARLREAGAEPGDRVLLVSVNTREYVAALFGVALAQCVAVPVNYRLHPGELATILRDAEPAVIFAQERYADRVAEAVAASGMRRPPAHLPLTAALLEPGQGADPGGLDDDAATAVILYTSGTTAAPKGVMLTHAALSGYVMSAVEPTDGTARGTALLSAPLHHVAGLAALLNALWTGRTTYLLPQFDAGDWIAAVQRERVTHAFVVPTMLARILDDPSFATDRLGSLQALTYGAAPMPPSLIRRAVARFPRHVDFTGAYGQTETSSTVAVLAPEDHRLTGPPEAVARTLERLGSVGRVVDDVEARIVDEAGEPVATGEAGELQLRTARSMRGYWRAPTSGSRVTVDDEGWLSTGDWGRMDADGYIFLGGRRGDLIIRGGENVAPEEVEAVLHEHPDVVDAGVVGLPDEQWGERIAAAVVARHGSELSVDDVRRFAQERLAAHRRPELLVLLDELPRTATGKLVRRTLAGLLAVTPSSPGPPPRDPRSPASPPPPAAPAS